VQVLPNITKEQAAMGDGMLNTCSQDVLLELLRFLKRAYWPFSWDSAGGPDHAGDRCSCFSDVRFPVPATRHRQTVSRG